MTRKPFRKLGLRDFVADLRRADPTFWIVAALIALFSFLAWLTG